MMANVTEPLFISMKDNKGIILAISKTKPK